MHFRNTKLLAILVITCLSAAFFASPTYAATASTATHRAVAHTQSQQDSPKAVSGGGCSAANPAVAACISINRSALVVPDAYVNLSLGCPYEVDVIVWWYNGSYHSLTGVDSGSCVNGHIIGHAVPIFAGAQFYYTEAVAYYSNGNYDLNFSPTQYV